MSDKLLIYGNWSGPGWTAGRKAAPYIAKKQERILSAADRKMDGVDAFDNFVSKAHDLNEIDAEVELRRHLGALGLISNKKTTTGDAYTSRPKYDDEKRFVSYAYYREQLIGGHSRPPGSEAERATLAKAFVNYYQHIAKSNGQFVTDFVENLPSLRHGGYGSAILMHAKLLGAGHLFLCETKKVHDCIQTDIVGEFGKDIIVQSDVADYLNTKFVSPHDDDDFKPVNGQAFKETLTRKEVLAASARDFSELYGAYVRMRNATKPNIDFRKNCLRRMRSGKGSGRLELQKNRRRMSRVGHKYKRALRYAKAR
ncbi:hypothetical protein QMT40_002772 [Parvibaculaceae bacterium PLY_AMNH_Bact1]|nr:hypothetical protein QMT40_002772 [Parvibaculaceae bacterium PLY_AMNH_Bact1]